VNSSHRAESDQFPPHSEDSGGFDWTRHNNLFVGLVFTEVTDTDLKTDMAMAHAARSAIHQRTYLGSDGVFARDLEEVGGGRKK